MMSISFSSLNSLHLPELSWTTPQTFTVRPSLLSSHVLSISFDFFKGEQKHFWNVWPALSEALFRPTDSAALLHMLSTFPAHHYLSCCVKERLFLCWQLDAGLWPAPQLHVIIIKVTRSRGLRELVSTSICLALLCLPRWACQCWRM